MGSTIRRAADIAWPALAFAAAALALAFARTAYDDEWFSIDLAREPDASIFWTALARDMHPPYLAWLDRGLHALGLAPAAMHVLRVACATAALAVIVPLFAHRARLPAPLLWLSGLHPIVWMYAGAARWYPLLLLAHALRLRAVLDDRLSTAARGGLFVLGAALGAMAGYIDLVFLVHDVAFALVLALVRARDGSAPLRRVVAPVLASAAASVLFIALLRALSPLGLRHGLPHTGLNLSVASPLRFGALGLFGESLLPWPLSPLAAVLAAALIAGVLNALRDPSLRLFAWHALSSGAAWLIATQVGVWHPRYGLCLWLELALLAACLARASLPLRALAAGALLYCVAIGSWMFAGHGFLKADLNGVSEEDCRALRAGAPRAQLAIAPYPRLAALLVEHCALEPRILTGSAIRSLAGARPVTGPLGAAFHAERSHFGPGPVEVWLLTLATTSSLDRSDREIRALLSSSCEARERTGFGGFEHAQLRARLGLKTASTRFVRERFVCRGPAPDDGPTRHPP